MYKKRGDAVVEEKTNTKYSWSRINSFHLGLTGEGCLWNYHTQYIEGDRGEGNFFSSYGTLMHDMIEKLHKNEIFEWDIENELKKGYKNLDYKAPFPRMGDSYKKAIFDFFIHSDFSEQFKDYEILEAEEECFMQIDDIHIRGFADMIGRHKKYGLVVADYKSSKVYEGDKLDHNIMQLYLYAIAVKEKYGSYPDNLIYWFPREHEGKREHVYRFDLDKLKATKQFIRETVYKIENFKGEWSPRCNSENAKTDFFANQLCDGRAKCEFKNPSNKKSATNPFEDDDSFKF